MRRAYVFGILLGACLLSFADNRKPLSLRNIDGIVAKGIRAHAFPGCQVFILKDGKPIFDRCYGTLDYQSNHPVTPNTLYDLASLTKTTGTLFAIMKLYDEGRIQLNDSIGTFLPFLQGTDKSGITLTELLFHESGFPPSLDAYRLVLEKKDSLPDSSSVTLHSQTHRYQAKWVSKIPSQEFSIQVTDSFYLLNSFHDSAMALIARTRLHEKAYRYSCINFILLKEVAERVSGTTLDRFLDSIFYRPMGLENLCFRPLNSHPKDRIAPTLQKDFLRGGPIQGYVHDPDAAFLGGVSGNAGLFGTAQDVAILYQMLLNGGEWNGNQYLKPETCALFTTTTSASGRRGLGFDKPVPGKPGHNPCCRSAPIETYGHTGYTGTCCWVDPVNKLVYVFLSNRTFPNDGINRLARMNIRTNIQETIYQTLK